MIKVAICDDIPEMTTQVEMILNGYQPSEFQCTIFLTSEKLIDSLDNNDYDIFILDIELPGCSGIEIAKLIRKKNYNVPIIFLTSYSQYMPEVFEVQTFDYIIKPVNLAKLTPVLDRVIRYLDLDNNHFSFMFNRISHNLKFNDIMFFEKQRRQVIIHTVNDNVMANMSTADILEKLDNSFVQVHNSFIINPRYIQEVGNNYVILGVAGESLQIPISRKFKNTARDKMISQLRKEI
ncbi:sensory transduction protein LytR [Lentilactobacillus sunkii]|uniref:Sensory transduction protein LytR n=1 Tax=Lentilactobacillus sunkii TaxID=481719 RepID=A0A1E7X8F9_9LACO|nr:LytTR family DNA-binding domain-containing protein [Lentilactobacillus sunkii]OFA09405.1 sensory transduction protein LytR [Lentilactobacillus sunkii]